MYHIASAVIASNNEEPTFTNIPQNFTHLQFRIVGRSPATSTGGYSSAFDWPYMRFNGVSSTASYSDRRLNGDGAAVTSATSINDTTAMRVGIMPSNSATAGIFGVSIIDILDYSNTNKNKTIRYISGCDANGSGLAVFGSGLFSNTSAVTSVFFGGWTSGYLVGTRIDLYGIVSSQIATGA
jgi:hypothetical protein